MEEEFRAILTGTSAVTALVPASRINWGEHPQGAGWPGIVLNVIDALGGAHMNGPNDPPEARVQVDCYALTYGEAKLVSRAAFDALHFYSGGGFQGVFHAGTRDSREGGSNEAERPFRASLDFTLAWRQANG